MNSSDFQAQFSNDNHRSHVLEELAEFCSSHNVSYRQTDKKFTIDLPPAKETTLPSNDASTATRKRFDIKNWGPTGVDETNLPDELPLEDNELNEGETPGGDRDNER